MNEEMIIAGEAVSVGIDNTNNTNNTNNMHDNSEFLERENNLTEQEERDALVAASNATADVFRGEVEPMQNNEAGGSADFSEFSDLLSNFVPTAPKEEKSPVLHRGFFKARIESIKRYSGDDKNGNPYDMYSFVVNAYAKGNKKTQGYIGEKGKKFSETFSLIDGLYNNAKEDFKKLLNFLFYAGIEIKFDSWDSFDKECANLEGKTCFIKVKPKMQWLIEGEGNDKTFTPIKGDDGKQLPKLDKDGYPVYTFEIVPAIPNMLEDDDGVPGSSSAGFIPPF